jgi:hypothetical protein
MDASEWRHMRSVPLDTVLEGFGARRDPKDPRHNWRIGTSRISVSGERFFDHQREVGGGGAVDLTLHLMGSSVRRPRLHELREAARWLGAVDKVKSSAVAQASDPQAEHGSRPAPVPDRTRLIRVRGYLTQQRAIPEAVIDEALQRGSLFADSRGNAVFRLHDETGREIGYELRGTGGRPFHSVHGDKGLFFAGGTAARVAAFVESGIEALSYRALHKQGLAISATGNAIERPDRMARHLRERGFRIVAAFNADRDGDRFAERFAQRLGDVQRERPRHAKDWNEVLQMRHGRDLPQRASTIDAERALTR